MSANALPGAWAQGSDEIRVGLVGCGGRGTGAARNVVDAAPGVRIVAMADAFKDRLDESRTRFPHDASLITQYESFAE